MEPTWWSWQFHFFVWLCIGSALPLLGVILVGQSRRHDALAWLSRMGGPLLVGLVWLHGVFFAAPNNLATMARYGFWKFWFMPHSAYRLAEHLALVLMAILPGLLVITYALIRNRKSIIDVSTSNENLAGSYLCFLVAALSLRPIPDTIMDVAMRRPHLADDPAWLVSELGPTFAVILLIGGFFWASACRLRRPAH